MKFQNFQIYETRASKSNKYDCECDNLGRPICKRFIGNFKCENFAKAEEIAIAYQESNNCFVVLVDCEANEKANENVYYLY